MATKAKSTGPRPWWESQKVMVFLICLFVITGCLMTLILTGKLDVDAASVAAYLGSVSVTGSSVILGRAHEGAAASRE